MQPQYTNKLVSSVKLWLDHLLLNTGQAFYNVPATFYLNNNARYSNFYTYSLPYNQIVSDVSVPNANFISGIYVGNTYVPIGSSGLAGINYEQGCLYFTGAQSSTVTGYVSVKEFNTSLTSQPETSLMLETKHYLRPKTLQSTTGLNTNEVTYPAIYVKENSTKNEPFAFGGQDKTTNYLRLMVFADSLFNLDAVNSLIRDQAYSYIPIFDPAEFPYNTLGSYKSGVPYNYNTSTANKIGGAEAAYIEEVFISKFNQNTFTQQIKSVNSEVFMSIIDLDVCNYRYPRQ